MNDSFAVTVLVGGRGYRLEAQDVGSLLEWLDRAYGGDDLIDDEGDAARTLIRALKLRISTRDGEGVIEPSDMQIEVLAGVLRDFLVIGSPGLSALAQAVRRFRGDPEYRSLQ